MENLPQERLSIACAAVALAERRSRGPSSTARSATRSASRSASSRPPFQARRDWRPRSRWRASYVDRCIEALNAGELDRAPTAAGAKYWTTDLQCKVVDECVQLHGGYGYMGEYEIAGSGATARVQRHLRRHQRDHEGDRRSLDGVLKPARSSRDAGRATRQHRAGADAARSGPSVRMTAGLAGFGSPRRTVAWRWRP